jgi:hypothetical protein
MKLRLVLFSMVAVAVLSVSCWNPFAPPTHEPPDNVPELSVKARTTPGNVINNLSYAMNNRDIEVFEDCLDEGYLFYIPGIYPDDPEFCTDLNKDDEVTNIRRLFNLDPGFSYPKGHGFQVIEFTFSHGNPRIESAEEAGDEFPYAHPDENWVIYEGIVTIYLYLEESKEHGVLIDERMKYKLREDSEGNWVIVRWEGVIPQ